MKMTEWVAYSKTQNYIRSSGIVVYDTVKYTMWKQYHTHMQFNVTYAACLTLLFIVCHASAFA